MDASLQSATATPVVVPVISPPLGVSETEAIAEAGRRKNATGLGCSVWLLTDGTYAAGKQKPVHAVTNVGAFLQDCCGFYRVE